MNKIIFNYLLKNFLKTFLVFVVVFYCFGMILNLFEEIEFFKDINTSILIPLILTSVYIPSMIVKILPFIIFLSSMWFMLGIRNNRDLLTLKVFGYSNLKIFFILAFTSFVLGWIILFAINPITSTLSKYYEQTKSNYSRDVDHLVSFNNNGLWIKEVLKNKQRIISAKKIDDHHLIDVTIFHLNSKSFLIEKIHSKKINIKKNLWFIEEGTIVSLEGGLMKNKKIQNYEISSTYDYKKINSLFKNFDTMSFLDLILGYKKLLNNGYNNSFLMQSLHSMLSLPFFLFLMTALASTLTLNTLKKSDNFRFIILGLIITVLIFYFKDFSLALGKTERIPLVLAVWAPIIALSLFTFIGVLQINEK